VRPLGIGFTALQFGARMEGGTFEVQACNCPATATVVRWSRPASLECLRTKAEDKANAMRRIKVTAARPRLGTDSLSPDALTCLGRCWQACKKPCLKAQCLVRSIQPLFSCFQRLWPSWRMTVAGKACCIERGDPQPFMIGGMGSQFPLAISVSFQHLFGTNDAHWFRVFDGEWQSFGVPELDVIGLVIALLSEGLIRRAGVQTDRPPIDTTGVSSVSG